ncbi:hypothetical protein [Nocardia coffeae]|uniref:hypothetical protein n=1 Tax=Nocardia coffeae TaxID=2873381 RepID=UPI0027E0140F|nr:hypothetical protein [Nocardia coffeae]
MQGVAATAAGLSARLGCDGELLADAAILHDVGYAPRLAVTGFHPLDAAAAGLSLSRCFRRCLSVGFSAAGALKRLPGWDRTRGWR